MIEGTTLQGGQSEGLLDMLKHDIEQKFESDLEKLLGDDDAPPSYQNAAQDNPPSYQNAADNGPSSDPFTKLGASGGGAPGVSSGPQASGGGALGDIKSDLGLLSTIEDAGKKLGGDSQPGTNEMDRLGSEVGILSKEVNLMKELMGLASRSEDPSSLASNPMMANKTTVL